MKNYRLKLSAALTLLFVAGLFAYGARVRADNDTKVINVAGDYIEAPAPAQVEEQTFGAMATDLSVSPVLNVNGFERYVFEGKLGNGLGFATTTVAFKDPFQTVTTTVGGVVIDQVTSGFGYTGATSTVELVEISGTATSTLIEFDCTASANAYTTSTPAIVDTETAVNPNVPFYIRSGMSSTTNAGAGSYVEDSTGGYQPVTQILLTPQKPYLVCKVWHQTGLSLTSFTDSNGTAAVKITAIISRRR